MFNQRVLDSIGEENYEQYMIITNGKEIDSILDSSPMFELYKYRDKLLNEGVGQDVNINELEQLLKNNDDIKLKQQLENLFLESISNSKFKIIKNILVNHELGWNISRLVEIHKEHIGHRIFNLLSIDYEDWINSSINKVGEM